MSLRLSLRLTTPGGAFREEKFPPPQEHFLRKAPCRGCSQRDLGKELASSWPSPALSPWSGTVGERSTVSSQAGLFPAVTLHLLVSMFVSSCRPTVLVCSPRSVRTASSGVSDSCTLLSLEGTLVRPEAISVLLIHM